MEEVLRIIEALGLKSWDARCYAFHITLKIIWPESKGYYNGQHVITKIGDHFFDRNGIASNEGYTPIEDWHTEEDLARIFKHQF